MKRLDCAIISSNDQSGAGKPGAGSFFGVNTGLETIKCPRADSNTTRGEGLGWRGGGVQVDDVDEASISPSKCNKRKGGQ